MVKKVLIIIAIFIGLFFITNSILPPSKAYGSNKPWDQGHDSTDPDDPDDPPDPPDPPNDPHGGTGSPLYVRSGNFIKVFIDLSYQACGKPIKITRVYNSFDKHDSLLGYGWTLSYSIRLLESRELSGEQYVLALMPNGQRYKFTRNADGTYTSPPGTIFTLKKENDKYVLEDNLNLRYIFDSDGYITTIEDKHSNKIQLTYQSFGGCFDQISDSNGRALNFVLGANGKISSISDPAGNIVLYEYDANGDLIKVTDPEGGETRYTYDSNHNLTKIMNPDNETVVTVSYQGSEPYRVSSYIENGETYYISYVSSNRTDKKDSLNQITKYEYLDSGLITKVTSPMGHVIAHDYNADFNYGMFTDQNGNATAFSYDTTRNLTVVQDGLSNAYNLSYDQDGNVTSITDPLNRSAQLTYDQDSNLTSVIMPNGDAVSINYDAKGYISSIFRGADTLTFSRDANCNLVRMQASNGSEVNITYDNLGNPGSITQNGFTTNYSFNKLNKITHVSNGGETIDVGYDASGRVTSVTYPGNKVMNYAYSNTFGILNKITYPDGSFYEYDYFSFTRLKTLKNENSETNTYAYDADHRLVSKTFPDGSTLSYTYDNSRNVTKIVDTKLGTVLHLTYDAVNRLKSISNGTFTDNYQYDNAGNRISKTDESSNVTTYSYDSLNRLTGIVQPDGTPVNFSPPLSNLGFLITLNDIIGLYNSQQNIRLLSYIIRITSNQVVNNVRYDLQFERFQNGIDEHLLTGFSSYELPYPDTYSVAQISSLSDFLNVYKRLGLGQ